MWTLIKKIWENRQILALLKTVVVAFSDGKITKDEAKKIMNDAIDAFMKE